MSTDSAAPLPPGDEDRRNERWALATIAGLLARLTGGAGGEPPQQPAHASRLATVTLGYWDH